MEEEKSSKKEKMNCEKHKHHGHHNDGGFGGFYFCAMIGVAIYYIQQVDGFWPVVLAILKAMVWPVFLLYKVFTMLNM